MRKRDLVEVIIIHANVCSPLLEISLKSGCRIRLHFGMEHDAFALEVGIEAEIDNGHVERLWMRRWMCLIAELAGDIGSGGDGRGMEVSADQCGAEFPCAREDGVADKVVAFEIGYGIGEVSLDVMLSEVVRIPFRAEAVKSYDERGGGKSARTPRER